MTEYDDPILVDKEIVLKISRVPRGTKKEFVSLALAQFEGDYGMTLKFIFDQAMEYQQMKYSLFNGLLYPHEQTPALQEEQKPKKKMLGGREIEIKGGKTNG